MEASQTVPADGIQPVSPEKFHDLLANVGEWGNMEMVKLADLHVDHTYQRDLSNDLVQSIASDFRAMASGPILVSRRVNGDLYIVNGQHRAAGAQFSGREEMLAQVIEGLNQEQEADLRLATNVRRSDRSHERFRAQLAAKNPESLAIAEIAGQFDTKINAYPDAATGINAIATVERIYRAGDGRGTDLVRTFEFVRDAFGSVAGKAASVAMLQGAHWMLDKHAGEFDRQRMMERLGAEGAESIDRKARSHKAALGGALWANYYRTMVEVYNQRLPERSRLEWRTSGWSKSGQPVGGQ